MGVLNGPQSPIECPRLWRSQSHSLLCGQVSAPATLPPCYLLWRFPNFVCSFRVLMRIVRVQKLGLSRGKGLLSHRYSAPLRRTSWVVGPSTRGHSRTSVWIGQLRCWSCSARNVFLRGPLTPILLFSQSCFLPLSPNPHSLTCLRRRLSRCTSTGTLLGFCRIFPRIRLRLVSRRTFGRLFSAGASERPSPRCLPTLTVARCAPARWVLILWVVMSSLASSTQVLFAVTIISWM